jgi:hypothetical protein
MRKPEVIFFVPKIIFSLLLSFLIKNMFIFFNISAFLAYSCGFKIYMHFGDRWSRYAGGR